MDFGGAYKPTPGHNYVGYQLAKLLAWAVGRDIPFPQALRTMTTANPLSSFNTILLRAVADLEKGRALGGALRQHMGRYLPRFYLAGVTEAEEAGALPAALPALAHAMRWGALPKQIAGNVAGAIITPYVILIQLLGILTFIVPKFTRMSKEFLAPEALPPLTAAVSAIGDKMSDFPMILIGFAICLPIILIFRRPLWGAFANSPAERLVLFIPLLGPSFLRVRVLQAAQGMTVALRRGYDIVAAAERTRACCVSWFLKQRFAEFIERTRAGAPWHRAWRRMHLGTPLGNWLLTNSAVAEEPATGFSLLGDFLFEGIRRGSKRVGTCGEVLTPLALGAGIGSIVVAFFLPLIQLTRALAES